ncbi:MAG: nickel ABC transporter, nickel/metallophore periplasmic binding protein [Candidatus Epulonipiscioides saccharophilum]|nr:MAG: nickel ABC transporter, nickel/metallophore periplasmic binding protein [Epulopiscium sp. AS2M-Bin001]
MTKLLSMLISSTVMLTLLSGCGNNDAEQSQSASNEPKTELVFANFRDIRDPNPHLYQGEMWFQELVYETLVSVENSGIEPCLAESWEISEDGLTYTFKIREGVTFTNGEVCNALAIKANFDAIWDNIDRHVWMESARLVASYEAPDERTFIITLSEPYSPFLTELGVTRPYGIAAPATMKNGTTKDGVIEYIGSGTYKMGEYIENEYVVMEVNENYWAEKPSIESIRVKVIPENQTRVLALQKGEVDLIYGGNLLDAQTLASFEDNNDFVVATSDPTLTKHLLMNSSNPILKDISVRKAINHAVNKEAINEGIFFGMEIVANNLYANNVPYCNIELDPYEFDIAKSEKLLDEAGWKKGPDGIRTKDGVRLSLGYLYDNNTVTDKSIGEYLQSEFRTLGIELKLEGFERETYFDMSKLGEFDIMMNIPWGNPYDPHAALSAMRGPVYGDYAAQLGLDNKSEIDANITDVLTIVDEQERQDMYTKILTDLHESAVYIPLVYETNKAVYSTELKDVGFMPSSYVIPFWDMQF